MEEDIEHLKELKVELEDMSITGPTSEDRLNTHRKSLAIENILNELERLQKENKELKGMLKNRIKYTQELEKDLFENCSNYVVPKQVIRDLIKQLEKDEENITKKYKAGKSINCYLSSYDRIRIRAYRVKTKEIKERIQELLEE